MTTVYSFNYGLYFWCLRRQFIVSTAAYNFDIFEDSLQHQLQPVHLEFMSTVYCIVLSLYF